MSQYSAQRFGQDTPSRIVTGTPLLLEATNVPPDSDTVQPLIPFYPANVPGAQIWTGADVANLSLVSQPAGWKRVPTRCDITYTQGDDIVAPFDFQGPADVDMSVDADWQWFAQVHTRHSYRSLRLYDFLTATTYTAPVAPETIGTTKVELFLPRTRNLYRGFFQWELYSVNPDDFSRFLENGEPWSSLTSLRTWLYGLATVIPRTTSTDVLPQPIEIVYPIIPEP